MAGTALLVAGGTGGHLFPALALREALVLRGWSVHVATDPRVGDLIQGVPPEATHRVRSATIALGSPKTIARSIWTMLRGVRESQALIRRLKPQIVVGFGGYPTVPPLVAARMAGIPILVHEQNAVLGRANRLIVRAGAVLATSFPGLKGAKARRIVHVGNPVRGSVKEAAAVPFNAPGPDEPFHLLVFGGSQGARVFSGLIPGGLAQLAERYRSRLRIVQQARPEDEAGVREVYRGMGISAEVSPFFTDMPRRIADAHLVICRSGASSVAELATIGRPAILVPYPHALDHDQAENARALAQAGGGWVVPESRLTVTALAEQLASLMDDPDRLRAAADAARGQGRPDAAERLADLVQETAARTARGAFER